MGYRSNPTLLRLGKRLPWTANSFVKYDYSLEYSKHLHVYNYINQVFKKSFFLSRALFFSHMDFFYANGVYFLNLHLYQRKLRMLKKVKFLWRFTNGKSKSLRKSRFLRHWRPWKRKARFNMKVHVNHRHFKALINLYLKLIVPFLKHGLTLNSNDKMYFIAKYVSKLVDRSNLLNVFSQLIRQNSRIFLYFRKYKKLLYSLKNYILAILRIMKLMIIILDDTYKPYVYSRETSAIRYKHVQTILEGKKLTLLANIKSSKGSFIKINSPQLLSIYKVRKSPKYSLNFEGNFLYNADALLVKLKKVVLSNKYNYYKHIIKYLKLNKKTKSFKSLYTYYKRKNNKCKILKYLTYLKTARYSVTKLIFKKKLLSFNKILKKYLLWKYYKQRHISNRILKAKKSKNKFLKVSIKPRKYSSILKHRIFKYTRYFRFKPKYLRRKPFKFIRNKFKGRYFRKKLYFRRLLVPFKFKKFRLKRGIRKLKLRRYSRYKNLIKYTCKNILRRTGLFNFYIGKHAYQTLNIYKRSVKSTKRLFIRYLKYKKLDKRNLRNIYIFKRYNSNMLFKKHKKRFIKSKLFKHILSNLYAVPRISLTREVSQLVVVSSLIKDLYSFFKLFVYKKLNDLNIVYTKFFVLFYQLNIYYNIVSKILKHLWYNKITNVLKSDIIKILNKPLILNYISVIRGSYHPDLITRFIVFRLLNQYRFGEVIFPLFKEINRNRLKSRIKGFMLICSGRLTRRQRASRRSLVINTVGLGKLSSKITYSFNTVQLRYGMSSIKLYVSYSDN